MSESAREREVNTPTPWKYRSDDWMIISSEADNSWHVAQMKPQGHETEANAVLIVRAVDAHQALAEALKSAKEWLSSVEGHLRDGQPFKRDKERIEAALKLAESD